MKYEDYSREDKAAFAKAMIPNADTTSPHEPLYWITKSQAQRMMLWFEYEFTNAPQNLTEQDYRLFDSLLGFDPKWIPPSDYHKRRHEMRKKAAVSAANELNSLAKTIDAHASVKEALRMGAEAIKAQYYEQDAKVSNPVRPSD